MGDALMDCVAQPGGSLKPLMGGSPFNLARACAQRLTQRPGVAQVGYVNPFSTDLFGGQLTDQLAKDGVTTLLPATRLPTSLAVVQLANGQPSYGFYREGIADRDYTVDQVCSLLESTRPGILHVGSLALVPPEVDKVHDVVALAKKLGWTISIDVNMRPKLAENLKQYIDKVLQISKLADWLKASDEDLQVLNLRGVKQTGSLPQRSDADSIAPYFLNQGTRRLALTFGAQGAWLQVDGHSAQAGVPQVEVVDTVGAGDTFWGNCLGDWALDAAPDGALGGALGGAAAWPTQAAQANRLPASSSAGQRVAQTLRQAMQAAAINCTRAGCQPPAFAELAG